MKPLLFDCTLRDGAYITESMFGAAAMSLSSVCVVTNALRLNHVKIS